MSQDSSFNPTTGSSGTSVSIRRASRYGSLQPHNGFIWNFCPWLLVLRAVEASTPQRVHLEPGLRVANIVAVDASTPQRVHLERRQHRGRRRPTGCFNPTTGSSGTRGHGAVAGSQRLASTPQRVHLERRRVRRRREGRRASTPQRVHLEPGRWVHPEDCPEASTPQRVHLERGSVERRPDRARVASTPQRVHLELRTTLQRECRHRCFNPTTGSSGTSYSVTVSS